MKLKIFKTKIGLEESYVVCDLEQRTEYYDLMVEKDYDVKNDYRAFKKIAAFSSKDLAEKFVK